MTQHKWFLTLPYKALSLCGPYIIPIDKRPGGKLDEGDKAHINKKTNKINKFENNLMLSVLYGIWFILENKHRVITRFHAHVCLWACSPINRKISSLLWSEMKVHLIVALLLSVVWPQQAISQETRHDITWDRYWLRDNIME